jgi:hypothetical protein
MAEKGKLNKNRLRVRRVVDVPLQGGFWYLLASWPKRWGVVDRRRRPGGEDRLVSTASQR